MFSVALRTLSIAWPGAFRTWSRAESSSLLTSIAFAWFVSFLLIATFVWPEWLQPWMVRLLWCAVFGVAGYSLLKNGSFGELPEQDTRKARDHNLVLAQAAYLQASYFESEKHLLENLAKHPSDIESALLLVSVYRRTERWDPALEVIQQLQRRDLATRWSQEIAVEKERCLRGKRQSKPLPPPTP